MVTGSARFANDSSTVGKLSLLVWLIGGAAMLCVALSMGCLAPLLLALSFRYDPSLMFCGSATIIRCTPLASIQDHGQIKNCAIRMHLKK